MKALLEFSPPQGIYFPGRVIICVNDVSMQNILLLKGKRLRKVERGVVYVVEILDARLGADKVASSGDWGECPKFRSFGHFINYFYLEVYDPVKR